MSEKLIEVLREENKKLLKELLIEKKFNQLFESYRNLTKNFCDNCLCDKNSENKQKFNYLENEYKIIDFSKTNFPKIIKIRIEKQTENNSNNTIQQNLEFETISEEIPKTTIVCAENEEITDENTDIIESNISTDESSEEIVLSENQEIFEEKTDINESNISTDDCSVDISNATDSAITCYKYKCDENDCNFKTNFITKIREHRYRHAFERKMKDIKNKRKSDDNIENESQKKLKVMPELETDMQLNTEVESTSDDLMLNIDTIQSQFETLSKNISWISAENFAKNEPKPENLETKKTIKPKAKRVSRYYTRKPKKLTTILVPIMTQMPGFDSNFIQNSSLNYNQDFENDLNANQSLILGVFECSFCKTDFASEEYLFTHMETVHKIYNSFECRECQKRFPTECLLTYHKHIIHKEIAYNCFECQDFITQDEEEFKRHREFHNDSKPFKCAISGCHNSFDGEEELKTHNESYHKVFECEKCSQRLVFPSKTLLDDHIKQFHETEMLCNFCDYKTFDKEVYEKHIYNHQIFCTVEGCPLGFRTESLLEIHINRDHKKITPYECYHCFECFSGKSQLDKHLVYKHREDIYKCDLCEYKTREKGRLTTHKKFHTNEKPFKCSFSGCEMSFKIQNTLKCHERNIHNNGTPFVCVWPECEAVFNDKIQYKYHNERHKGLKPYFCEYNGCEATFSYMKGLKRHKFISKH